jgi:hypothetical protein
MLVATIIVGKNDHALMQREREREREREKEREWRERGTESEGARERERERKRERERENIRPLFIRTARGQCSSVPSVLCGLISQFHPTLTHLLAGIMNLHYCSVRVHALAIRLVANKCTFMWSFPHIYFAF